MAKADRKNNRPIEDFLQSLVYLNPLTDFGFKKLFFDEMNKDLLIAFLNEIIQGEQIADVQYRPTEQLGDWEEERKAVYDIFCTNDKGEYFIVEMQNARQAYFEDRALFYASFPIRNQAPKGGRWNYQLKAVYLVAILDFIIFKEPGDEKYVIEHVHLLRDRTKTKFSEKLNFYFIELPKFKKTVKELKTNADCWLFLLKNLGQLSERPPQVQGRIFERLFEAAQTKKLTSTEMETYQKSVLEYNDVRNAIDYAKEESFEEGRVKGRIEERDHFIMGAYRGGLSLKQIQAFTDLGLRDLKKILNL